MSVCFNQADRVFRQREGSITCLRRESKFSRPREHGLAVIAPALPGFVLPRTTRVTCVMRNTGQVPMFPDRVTVRSASLAAPLLALACLSLPALPAGAQAETPEEKGLRIAREASARNDGFGDFTASMTMVLRDRQGRESERRMRFKVLETPGDGDKSLFVFDRPRDVQGTALLTHAHVNAQDDQWLYLPALKRVKRINASRRSGSFMGSEFSYEDMSPPEMDEYAHKYLRDEPCGALTCTVTEQIPRDRDSGYSRRVVWQDTDELRIWKMELYDRKGAHLKTLSLTGYRQYLDRYWRAGEQVMENHLTGASTALKWTDFQFRNNLSESEFTQPALRRVR